MSDDLTEMVNLLENGESEKITQAAKKLALIPKEVVELPKDQLKNVVKILLESVDKPGVDDGELLHALFMITNEMIIKFDIILPEEQAISYEWFLSWFDQ
ncbi:MAG: hypothetical protein FK733_12260 [Asgard group archaeon]|nr:hypothetical protein [Asgard group archaeon]